MTKFIIILRISKNQNGLLRTFFVIVNKKNQKNNKSDYRLKLGFTNYILEVKI